MDINDFRTWHTVLMFIIFAGIIFWAWSSKRRSDFHEAANLPLNEPEFPGYEGSPERVSDQGVNNKVEGDTP
jgi:cytochrome c oxidase cbb3-type subunit 4